jgi:MtN3 and saliva related transmembrane protein
VAGAGMETWFLVGVIAAILTTFGFVPQIVKMYETKSARDVSLITLVQYSAGVTLWALYGRFIGDPILIAANIISLGILIVAIGLYLIYQRNRADSTKFCPPNL